MTAASNKSIGPAGRPPVRVWMTVAVVLAVIAVVIDFSTWVQLNVAIVYGLPLVAAAAARSARLIWGLTLALVGCTFVVYALQIQPASFSMADPFFIDRVLAAVSLVVAAGLLHALTVASEGVALRNRELDHQIQTMKAVNDQLGRQQEDIARRNRELDQQRIDAEEASDRKTRLLTSVSHDIRTPLTTLNVLADVIRSASENPDLLAKLPGLAQNLQANARALANLVTDVLDISYFDSGRIQLRESEFLISDLIREECRLLEPVASAKGLTLTQGTLDAAVHVRADRIKLARVLRNLLNNAVQFTDRGAVTIDAAVSRDGTLEIRVTDTGPGIASENRERVFNESIRLVGQAAEGNGGWGLGLPIARRLTRLMDGEVAIESRLGRGSVFIVSLPRSRVLSQARRI